MMKSVLSKNVIRFSENKKWREVSRTINTRTQTQRLCSIKTSEATKRTEQNYLIYSIGKLPFRPSKKCTRSSVYVRKLTGSISLNDLLYNSREIWRTALLWSPNQMLWPKPFGPVTARVYACTRFVSSQLNSRRLDERGCVCVMRQSGVMSHLGSGTWDSWGHLPWEEFTCPSAKRWPPDGRTAKRFMDEA